jgi:FAD:protein FMN transferase
MRNIFAFLIIFQLIGCEPANKPLFFEGATMGTTYHITLTKVPHHLKEPELKQSFDKLLAEVNQHMSTYKKDSELSLLNQNPSTDWIPISKPLFIVIQEALRVSTLSEGAFDVTVGPLVNLWGFGAKWTEEKIPTQEQINQSKQRVSYQYLSLQTDPPAIKKTKPDIYIDLSGIAKGYGVDVLADFLEKQGILNYLIEIGGELRTKGTNPQGEAWKVAIEKPIPNIRAAQTVIPVHEAGIATSGDYRNFFELNGRRFSHIIDPKTGEPVQTNVVSATILTTNSCMTADAWAKVPIVMGAEKALALADRENIAMYLLLKDGDQFVSKSSRAFQTWR